MCQYTLLSSAAVSFPCAAFNTYANCNLFFFSQKTKRIRNDGMETGNTRVFWVFFWRDWMRTFHSHYKLRKAKLLRAAFGSETWKTWKKSAYTFHWRDYLIWIICKLSSSSPSAFSLKKFAFFCCKKNWNAVWRNFSQK